MSQLLDAINALVAERDQAAAAAQTAAGDADAVAQKVNSALQEALEAITYALPVEVPPPAAAPPPARTRAVVSDERARIIRDAVKLAIIGAEEPVPIAKLIDELMAAGVLKKREPRAVEKALVDSSLVLVEGQGYLPAGSEPVAQAAE